MWITSPSLATDTASMMWQKGFAAEPLPLAQPAKPMSTYQSPAFATEGEARTIATPNRNRIGFGGSDMVHLPSLQESPGRVTRAEMLLVALRGCQDTTPRSSSIRPRVLPC